MSAYEYSLCAEDGSVTSGSRTTKFTLKELQELVGGRIEIIPIKTPVTNKITNEVYVIREDGRYDCKPNARFRHLYGPVLVTSKKSIE